MDQAGDFMEVEETRTSVTSTSPRDNGTNRNDVFCPMTAAATFASNFFNCSNTETPAKTNSNSDLSKSSQEVGSEPITNVSYTPGSVVSQTQNQANCFNFKRCNMNSSPLKRCQEMPLAACNREEQLTTEGANSSGGLDQVGSELVCSICQQYFLEASTVGCGHSFCRMCIDNWLKTKLTCPVCRQPVSKAPIASVCLDKAVQAILEITREEDIARELMERKMLAYKARQSETYAQTCLETLFQKAVQQGVRIVHISKRWSPREQQRFLSGIERHQGVAREAYCRVVGLTYEWVAGATADELLIAVSNVQLKDMEHKPCSPIEWKEGCISKLRCRLEMYIRYG